MVILLITEKPYSMLAEITIIVLKIFLSANGITIYKLYPQTNITVDGKSYNVSPYNGQFTPNSGHNYSDLFAKLVENNYKEGVGLVKSVCHSVRGTYNFEKHLVSYSLK